MLRSVPDEEGLGGQGPRRCALGCEAVGVRQEVEGPVASFWPREMWCFVTKEFSGGQSDNDDTTGVPLGQVVLAGDWRSLSVLRYLVEQEMDPYRVMDMHMQASDNEGSDGEEDD